MEQNTGVSNVKVDYHYTILTSCCIINKLNVNRKE